MKKYCKDCIFRKYNKGPSIITSGYTCLKNPFKRKYKDIIGYCEKRK